jgi:hypothetical protein
MEKKLNSKGIESNQTISNALLSADREFSCDTSIHMSSMVPNVFWGDAINQSNLINTL